MMRHGKMLAAFMLPVMLTGCAANTSNMDSLIEAQEETLAALTETAQETAPTPEETLIDAANDGYDVDLTILDSTMTYAQVYDMVYEADKYEGKSVRARGAFAYYQDQETMMEYFAVLISDATACCSQGIEFVLEGDPVYPEDYPAEGTEITITGSFHAYVENGTTYVQLQDAQILA